MSAKLKSFIVQYPATIRAIIGIVIAFFKPQSKKINQKATKQLAGKSKKSFETMSWPEFEKLVFEVFSQRGYSLVETRAETDDCVDIILTRKQEKTFVQCKRWENVNIDVSNISELYAVMKAENVRHGMVVTSGDFTQEAKDFSLGKSILLFNGEDLFQMFSTLKPSSPDTQQNTKAEILNSDKPLRETTESEPLCPVCNHPMLKRIARKGKNAGNTFWGCSQYPNCRGVLPG